MVTYFARQAGHDAEDLFVQVLQSVGCLVEQTGHYEDAVLKRDMWVYDTRIDAQELAVQFTTNREKFREQALRLLREGIFPFFLPESELWDWASAGKTERTRLTSQICQRFWKEVRGVRQTCPWFCPARRSRGGRTGSSGEGVRHKSLPALKR